MRYINGWLENKPLERGVLYIKVINNMKVHSFYLISDKFFIDFPDPYLKGNKRETRPHYYCLQDNKTGLYWMIPLSSKIDKFKKIMDNQARNNKPCDILHIAKSRTGKESVFLIQDIFPITREYILKEYTVNNAAFTLKNENDIKDINKKVTKVLGLIRRGIKLMKTQPDILSIEKALLEKLKQNK